jgi:hypothetical protein
LFYKELKSAGSFVIDNSLRKQLDTILKEEGNKVVFRHSRDEIKSKLQEIGLLIDKLTGLYELPQCTAYQTLCKVFTEQYRWTKTRFWSPAIKKKSLPVPFNHHMTRTIITATRMAIM